MRKIVTLAVVLGLLFASAACGAAGEPPRVREAREDYRVLVFTKTTDCRADRRRLSRLCPRGLGHSR